MTRKRRRIASALQRTAKLLFSGAWIACGSAAPSGNPQNTSDMFPVQMGTTTSSGKATTAGVAAAGAAAMSARSNASLATAGMGAAAGAAGDRAMHVPSTAATTSAAGASGSLSTNGAAGTNSPLTSDCDRACLIGALSGYLDALSKHDPSTLALAPDVRVTQNGRVSRIGEGLWQTVTGVRDDTRQDFADPLAGQVGSQLVLMTGTTATITNLRLRLVASAITEVEIVSVGEGDFDGMKPDPIFNQPITPTARPRREDLLKTAQAYEKLLESGSYSMSGAKFHPQMIRRENGTKTADAASLQAREGSGRPDIPSRYLVVDEEYGMVFAVYEFADNGLVPNELFKIINGEIRLLNIVLASQGGDSGWESP